MKRYGTRIRQMLDSRTAPTAGSSTGRLDGKKQFCGTHLLACMFLISALTMLTTPPLAAEPSTPMDVVKLNVGKVVSVLRDPALQDESAVETKKEALRSISNDLFNWPLLARSVLSRNWNNLTSEQQAEFITLFKEILEQTYVDRILSYKDEPIEYDSEQMLSDKKAEVQTHIISDGGPVNMTYRLALLDGKWGVYDVIVEGVSLTTNYRSQFRDYLADKTPAQLLEHLREKVGEK